MKTKANGKTLFVNVKLHHKKIDISNSIQSETLQILNGLNEAVKICRQIIFKSFGDENKRVVYFTGSEDFAWY